jgi:hypothetical protein
MATDLYTIQSLLPPLPSTPAVALSGDESFLITAPWLQQSLLSFISVLRFLIL